MHGCYRRSRLQTSVATLGLVSHRLRGTYRRDVDLFIAPTEFTRAKLIEAGLPADSIAVKPHFVADVEPGVQKDDFALFVGRLVPGKGVETLLHAWRRLDGAVPLKVVGEGPIDALLRFRPLRGVEYLGPQPRSVVFALMRRARLLVFPSEWYETFGLAIIEAFAAALPVVASRRGSMGELVENGQSGWHFEPGNAEDLARVVREAWSDPGELRRRADVARATYERKYGVARNHEIILSVYARAGRRFRARTRAGVLPQ
jgi:glycosyltransferase involved in cell wall biosynthesis